MHRQAPSDPTNAQLTLIADSFRRLTQRALVATDSALRQALWHADAAILAHGTENDPIFFYGNRRALELFEMSFEDFTQLPSRFSAEPLEREARAQLLARVSRDGYIDDYAGVRISASGRRFMIHGAVVWNLIDEQGALHGQAATFSRWSLLDQGS